MTPTFIAHRVRSLAASVFGLSLLVSVPAHAGSITFDDTLANETVNVTWAGMLNGFVFGLCTPQVPGGTPSGSVSCSEANPIRFEGDFVQASGNDGPVGVNFWEDHVGGTLSDTLRFVLGGGPDAGRHVTAILRSDVDGGPTLIPFVVGVAGIVEVVDWLEADGPITNVDDHYPDNSITIASDASPVPEPASLLLLGSGLAALVVRHRRTRA